MAASPGRARPNGHRAYLAVRQGGASTGAGSACSFDVKCLGARLVSKWRWLWTTAASQAALERLS